MIPIFAIFCKEFAKASSFLIAISLGPEVTRILLLFTIFQFLMAPVQGGLSDHYCRKKSLVLATCAVLFAQLIILFGVCSSGSSGITLTTFICLLLGFILDGMLGNVSTIARAALVDSKFLGSIRKALGYSFALVGLPWIVVFSANFSLIGVVSLTVFLNLISLFFVVMKFRDVRDLTTDLSEFSLQGEFRTFLKVFNSKSFALGMVAFLLSEIGFEFIFLYESEVVQNNNIDFIYPLFGLGFSCGALFQTFVSVPQKNMKGIILLGFAVAFISILINPLFFYFQGNNNQNELISLKWTQGASMLAATSGFYFPSVFALFSHHHKMHEQGKIFGFLESILNLGEMIVTAVFFFLSSLISQDVIIVLSSLMYLFAFLIFKIFSK